MLYQLNLLLDTEESTHQLSLQKHNHRELIGSSANGKPRLGAELVLSVDIYAVVEGTKILHTTPVDTQLGSPV